MTRKDEKFVKIIEFNNELFSILFITFLLLILTETTWKTSVYEYVNINYILIILILSGAISVFTRKDDEYKENIRLTMRCYTNIIIVGIIGVLIIWYNIKYIGNIAYWVSITSGILIILLSSLMINMER